MKKFIKVTTQFEGEHCYPEAPAGVMFLQNVHRHLFHVSALIEVFHDDRELEFLLVKRKLHGLCLKLDNILTFEEKSCERLADRINRQLKVMYGMDRDITVEVDEDGENGAIVCILAGEPI